LSLQKFDKSSAEWLQWFPEVIQTLIALPLIVDNFHQLIEGSIMDIERFIVTGLE